MKNVGCVSIGWRVAAVFAALTLSACGSRVSGGNTGSETHWLQSCDSDADCGEYACHCAVCTRGCERDSQCEQASEPDGQCVPASGLKDQSECGGEVPTQICVGEHAVVGTTDAGGGTDTGDGTNVNPGSDTTSPNPTSSSHTSETPLETSICDGSDDVRLWTQTTVGGLSGPTQIFAGANGWAYLAIDGKCNYWASTRGELFTGSITEQTVLRDYEQSYFGKLGRFEDFDPGLPCPDAPNAFVADPSGLVRINVCGANDAPDGYEETWDAITDLTAALVLEGQRSSGPIRIALGPAESGDAAWPIDLDPSAWVTGTLDYASLAKPDAGIWVNSGETSAALRAAGAGTYTYQASSGPAFLTLLVRDELPPKVAAALVAGLSNSANPEGQGATCDGTEDCSDGLKCQVHAGTGSGDSACNTCIAPGDADWACQSNDDCCGGLVCCLDCGEKTGTCIVEPDACETCISNGGSWILDPGVCDSQLCEPDSSCFRTECPGLCADDNCGGCGRPEECWAAGCQWDDASEAAYCQALPIDPLPEPCFINATDASLPGVTVHLEADTCTFPAGQGGQFRYTVEFAQSLEFTTESSGGGCGRCGLTPEAETWIDFRIGEGQTTYCPECDVGCCPPTDAVSTSLNAQSVAGTVDWPGLQWSGPSDTGSEPSGTFPPGSYLATVTVALPGLGQVVATLPIEVTAP